MSNCNECGAEVDDFEICTHGQRRGIMPSLSRRSDSSASDQSDEFVSESVQTQRAVNKIIFAPFGALFLDLLVPVWSTWYFNLLFIAFGSALFIQIARVRTSGRSLSFRLFMLGLIHSLNAPKLISNYSAEKSKNRNLITWVAVLFISFFAVFAIGTPANSIAIERAIKHQINKSTGLSPAVSCPRAFLVIPGKDVTCKVEAVLGITIPLKIQVKNPFEKPTWNLNPLR